MPDVLSVTSIPILGFSFSTILAEAIAKDLSWSDFEVQPKISRPQLGLVAKALSIVYKLTKDIPPVKIKTENNKKDPVVAILI